MGRKKNSDVRFRLQTRPNSRIMDLADRLDGTMTKGEETRQTIVEKAAALLNQRGFSGFSMSALMEATGLEKGGIYRHFDSKEQLASEAFEYAW
jgi:AcrR family transcriptional regulator